MQRLSNATKSRKELHEQLFLVDAASKYRDITVEVNISKQWSSAIAIAAPPTTLALVGVEPLVVAFVRENLSRDDNTVWSLPVEAFDSIRLHNPLVGSQCHVCQDILKQ